VQTASWELLKNILFPWVVNPAFPLIVENLSKDTNEIRLSIALVTRNRPESLERCLRSLRAQNVQPFEVIISDDSDAQYVSKVKSIAEQWDCHYISGPRRGLYANRNHAALACKGTHVRTMDDDHEFPEGHFDVVNKTVGIAPKSIWIIGEYGEHPTASSRLGLPGEIQPRGFSGPPQDYDDCFAISDGAAIYPRQIFNTHYYLEVFNFGHLYLEFGARLKALGYRIRFCSGTYIIHHYISNGRSFNDMKVEQKSSFLSAYLTYNCYFPNLFKSMECLAWFAGNAALNSLKRKTASFNVSDFWITWRLGRKYKNRFRAAKYHQIV
jgi:glycosyltransferase involved in cell wall biosynthesis